mgnify:CR=1 FL=1
MVSLEDKSATVRFDPTVLKLDELREAVEDCGFDVLDASSSDAPPSAPTAPTPPVTPSPTPSELPPAEIDFGSPRIITLAISGMSCRRCVDWVTQALRSVEGVSDATVDLSKHVATVEGVAGAAALVRRVSDTGYTARVIRSNKMTARGSTPTRVLDLEAPDDDEDSPLVNATGGASDGIRSPDRGERSVTLRVSGMSCASCVAKVEEAALTVPGVASATSASRHATSVGYAGTSVTPTSAAPARIQPSSSSTVRPRTPPSPSAHPTVACSTPRSSEPTRSTTSP